jgi:hypothetical protein
MNNELQILEERVAQLEQDILQLKSNATNGSARAWWERVAGRFENDPAYNEIMRLGREFREAQRPENV